MTTDNTQITRRHGIAIAVIFILIGMLWALILMGADALWGDAVAQWMAIIFGIVNGAAVGFFAVWLANRVHRRRQQR